VGDVEILPQSREGLHSYHEACSVRFPFGSASVPSSTYRGPSSSREIRKDGEETTIAHRRTVRPVGITAPEIDLESWRRWVAGVIAAEMNAFERGCGGFLIGLFRIVLSGKLSGINGLALPDCPGLICRVEEISFLHQLPCREVPTERKPGEAAREHRLYSISELTSRITAVLSLIEDSEIRPRFRPS
jgi:hypothetical protein